MSIAFKKYIPLISLSFLLTKLSFAQVDSAKIAAIRNHIEFVELLTKPKYAAKINTIVPSEYYSTTLDTGQLFSRKRRRILQEKHASGTWSIYTTSDITNKTVYAVIVNSYTKSHFVKKFFYEKNKLVFAEIQFYCENERLKNFYKSTEFYWNDSLIFKETTPASSVVSTDIEGIKIDLKKDGNFYLQRALEKLPFNDR